MPCELEIFNSGMLENNFVQLFIPIIRFQTIICSVRVKLKNKFATPPDCRMRAYAVLYVCYCFIAYCYLADRKIFFGTNGLLKTKVKLSAEYYLALCQSFAELFLHISIAIGNNFFCGDENAAMYVYMQNIDRSLRCLDGLGDSEALAKFIRLSANLVIAYHFVLNISLFVFDISLQEFLVSVPVLVSLIVEDLETLSFVCFFWFLTCRVKSYNALIMRKTAVGEDFYAKIWDAYMNVCRVFEILEKSYNPFITAVVVHTFINQLIAIEKFLVLRKNISWYRIIRLVTILIKLFVRVCLIASFVNTFKEEVKRTRVLCLMRLKESPKGLSRQVLKNIVRSTRLHMNKFCLLGSVSVDRLPISLASLTATYAVFLLQFAFL